MIKNTLRNTSENPHQKMYQKKKSEQLKSSSINVHIVGEDLLRALYKLLCLRFCVSSNQRKNTV